ncbi:MAG: DUF2064 domain-containing protein [Actinomycetota bacterium]|nr:DUF2064 domain-containing protein [Actinomycetota bacterium]
MTDQRRTTRSGPAAVLLVLAKTPVPGRVKTRLTPPCTPEQAADIAAAALLDTLVAVRTVVDQQESSGTRTVPVLALEGRLADVPDARRRDALRRATDGMVLLAQRGSGLPERIVVAHADAAASCRGARVLQIGMDTPQVTPELLAGGLTALAGIERGAVLAPAQDGGWWALGVTDPALARPVLDVPTSRADTYVRTRAALEQAGTACVLLPMLTDVDTWPVAVEVAALRPESAFAEAVGQVVTDSGGPPTAACAPWLSATG